MTDDADTKSIPPDRELDDRPRSGWCVVRFRVAAHARWAEAGVCDLLDTVRWAARDQGWTQRQLDCALGAATRTADFGQRVRLLRWHVIDPDDSP